MAVMPQAASDALAVVPIGVVRNGITEPHTVWEEVESRVVLDEKYAQALTGLDDFSHVIVVFWLHLSEPWEPEMIRPGGFEDLPEVGTFSTRSPRRPNPIGLTVVELVDIEENVMRVRRLDAVDGTPVLDVKPYIHYGDRVEDFREPRWVKDFNEQRRYLREQPDGGPAAPGNQGDVR